jgi:hypothetical protein
MLTPGAEYLGGNFKLCLSNVDVIKLRVLCISRYKASQPYLRWYMRGLPSHFNFKSKAHYKKISDIVAA